jgi:hypothetical protein
MNIFNKLPSRSCRLNCPDLYNLEAKSQLASVKLVLELEKVQNPDLKPDFVV